jgi:uncharacterized membrane protein
METTVLDDKAKSAKTLTMVLYVLYAASILIGITAIVAVIVNYVKKDAVAGTWIESHFRWQIRTFWFSMLWAVVGILLTMVVIGWVVLLADVVWVIYRVIKGAVALSDNKAMYAAA